MLRTGSKPSDQIDSYCTVCMTGESNGWQEVLGMFDAGDQQAFRQRKR